MKPSRINIAISAIATVLLLGACSGGSAEAAKSAAPAADLAGNPDHDQSQPGNSQGNGQGNGSGNPQNSEDARVVIGIIDDGLNVYHDFFHAGGEPYPAGSPPSAVTKKVLREFGVDPDCELELTRTGDVAADYAADANLWARAESCEVMWFVGTNILARAFLPYGRPVLPDDNDPDSSDEDVHATGVVAAALRVNPEAVILFAEALPAIPHPVLAPVAEDVNFAYTEGEAWIFTHPSVDVISTSYGYSGPVSLPGPDHAAMSFEGVHDLGKLWFSAADNYPTPSVTDYTAGPWWAIAIAGYEEGESNGRQMSSGTTPDFIADATQPLPFCDDCESGLSSRVHGTSFAAPLSAALVSKVILEARRVVNHRGAIRVPSGGGTPMMVEGRIRGEAVSITNWQIRRALEEAAWYPGMEAYRPAHWVEEVPEYTEWDFWQFLGAPIPPEELAVLQAGWGVLTKDSRGQIVGQVLARIGLPDGTVSQLRTKNAQTCDVQTASIDLRKVYWDQVAVNSATFQNAPDPDPFLYCGE